jgi:GTP cyclohydrolase II
VGNKNVDRLSVWFGRAEHIAAERGLAEFRSGRPVILTSAHGTVVGLPVDGLTEERLAFFRRLCAPARPHLVITAPRARVLGIEAAGPVGLAIGDADSAAAIVSMAAERRVERTPAIVPAGPVAEAAILLAKLAQQLPALLVAGGAAIAAASCEPPLITVCADAVVQFRRSAIASLAVASEAIVPLNGGLPARFVIFRDAIGGTSVAAVIGKPDFARPVPVRLHSACLTGDAFGSRRCDCGDQLRLALSRLDQQGGGIILYLEQEGRGLGLANKMRAYRLQDAGLDTLDANTTLGFDDDERDYGIAARMLQMLGCAQVLLLTNNPAKLDGLAQAGIKVSGRIALQVPSNPDNRRYLAAKATRAGHKLDHLLAAVADGEPVGGDGTP